MLVRRGHTEAAVDLARLAGLTPAGVLVEVVNDDGTMKRSPQLREFADEHGLAHDLHRRPGPPSAPHRDAGRARSPRPGCRPGTATSRPYGYRSTIDGSEHLALVYGDLVDSSTRRYASRC